MRIFRRRRALSNIVATLLIFAMMTIAMGILYSRIGPVAIGYEAEQAASNQEFIFMSLNTAVDKLIASPEGARDQRHMYSEFTTYDLNETGPNVQFTFTVGAVSNSLSAILGAFEAEINRTFQGVSNSRYIGVSGRPTTLINTEMTTQFASAVMYMDVRTDSASISYYHRASGALMQIDASTYMYTVFTYRFTHNPSSPISDFPVSRNEWTLFLLRGSSTVTNPFNLTMGAQTSFTLSQSAGGSTNYDTYTYNVAAGSTVIVKQIDIPIYFSV